jgi:hypothetical protein
MVTSRSAKTTSRRGVRASAVSPADTNGQSPENNEPLITENLDPVSEEKPMSQVEPVVEPTTPATKRKAKAGAIQLSQQQPSLAVWNRPVMASEIEVAGTIQVAGVRPIAASHLDVYGTILNNRPIMSSPLRLFEMLPGARPVFYSDIHMVEGEGYPGERPVMVSDPALLNASTLPGNRPIASNEIDDAPTLMGFID